MKKILVIDSGIGGLSTLFEIKALLPFESFIYFADNAFCPYGSLNSEFIKSRIEKILSFFDIQNQIKLVVIACNTATSCAISFLREEFPITFVGIEPAVNVAKKMHIKNATLLATPITIDNIEISEDILPYKCSNLANIIEEYYLEKEVVRGEVKKIKNLLPPERCNAIILGCTHYSLVKDVFESVFSPYAKIIDGNVGVANRVRSLLKNSGQLQMSPNFDSGKISVRMSDMQTKEVVKYHKIMLDFAKKQKYIN